MARFLKDKNFAQDIDIGFMTDESSFEDLQNTDDYIFHVVLQIENKLFDATGKITNKKLISNYDGNNLILTNDLNKALRVISGNTDYTRDWNFYYSFFESSFQHLGKKIKDIERRLFFI